MIIDIICWILFAMIIAFILLVFITILYSTIRSIKHMKGCDYCNHLDYLKGNGCDVSIGWNSFGRCSLVFKTQNLTQYMPIEYCPKCGRRLKDHKENTDEDFK